MIKKIGIGLLALLVAVGTQSCKDTKTYAEQLKEERDIIKQFIREQNIEVISMEQFQAQDSTTTENQYVEFTGEGVYMNVLHQAEGEGARLAKSNDLVLVRFTEVKLSTRDTISAFGSTGFPPDEFRYTRGTSTVLGQFVGNGMMQYAYGQSVPAGWLMPLTYLRLANTSGTDRTHIRLIVSAKNGQSDAIQNVYPCFYELKMQFPQ